MSGVEAAGFVLAAFPLLISALENYRETAEVFSDWWKFKREYRKCKDEIHFHQLSFEQNLEKYLLPLIADEEHLEALIGDPAGEAWHDPSLESKLKTRLPKAYMLYLSTIRQINEAMIELHDVLGTTKPYLQDDVLDENVVEESTRVKLKRLVSRTNIGYETHRAKFAVGKSVRSKIFKEIAELNSRLKELLDTSDEITSLRTARSASRGMFGFANGLSKVWIHASNIFKLLTQAWRCDCSPLHHVNLMLEHRTSGVGMRFHLLFLFSRSLKESPCPSWKSLRTRIDLADDLEASQPEMSRVQLSMSELSTRKSSPSSTRSSMKKKNSSPSGSLILEKSIESLSVKSKVTWSSDTPMLSRSSSFLAPNGTEPEDLCDSIAACNAGVSCLGVMRSDEHSYVMCPLFQEKAPAEDRDMVSLGSILRKEEVVKLTRRQRFFIALILASSQYQLHKTPWLGRNYSKDSILFLRDKSSPSSIILEQPFISRDFVCSDYTATVSQDPENTIPALGIMLLELCFGVPFEDQDVRKKYLLPGGQSNPYLDLAAGLEWCNADAAEEAGMEFAEAVKFCLGQFGSIQLDDKRRQDLLEKVIKPIQFCHQQFELCT